ncbi:MAG TPA: glycosyltransferase family 87 protein [Candidatus Sulfotelmatobacter sp.]
MLILLLICSAGMWTYWNRAPAALHAANIRTGLPQANALTDLYPRWYGSRELLLHHRDPYGAEVSREIQIAYYGRALNPWVQTDRLDQERFAYPLYVVFLLLPIVPLEFATVRIVVWWFLAAVTAASLWFWLRFLRFHLSIIDLVAILILALSSIPVMQGLSFLQLGLLVAALIAGAAACAASGQLFLAGMLMAVATIKPQMAVLPIAWFLLWTAGAWRPRRLLLFGFGATLAALILASELLLPAWMIRYPKSLTAYSEYTNSKSFLGTIFSANWSWVIAIVALLAVGWLGWKVRREPADSVWFAIVLAFVLLLTVTVVPTVNASFNQVLLLPAFLLAFQHRRELLRGSRLRHLTLYAVTGLALLPWLLAPIVALARPDLRNPLYSVLWSAPLLSSFALPLATAAILILLGSGLARNSVDTNAAQT